MPGAVAAMANTAWAIVFILGSCIFIHELGHFIAARLARMRVEEFMIGFPPRLLSLTRRQTRYGFGLIPFGGFCRIAGMEPGQEQVEGGFYTKPRYAQALVIAAGSVMNVLLAVGLFTLIGVVKGVPVDYVKPPTIDTLIGYDTPARQAGLRPQDSIIAVDGQDESLEIARVEPGSVADRLGLKAGYYVYGVNDEYAAVPSDIVRLVSKLGDSVTVKALPVVDLDAEQPPEAKLIKANREELGIPAEPSPDGASLSKLWGAKFAPLNVDTVRFYVMERPGTPIKLTINREGNEIDVTVTPKAEAGQVEREDAQGNRTIIRQEVGQIGITFAAVRRHDAAYALTTGLRDSQFIVKGVANMIYRAATGQGQFEGSGVVGIAFYAHKQAQIGWEAVLNLCAIISVNLAFLNLLPIPIADGGRLVLIGYEAVVRRRISSRREMAWLIAGAVLFVALFAVITFKDVWNLVKHHTP